MKTSIPYTLYPIPSGRRSGQIMLVTVLVLSSTMVVATAIAGLAMRQQIRNAAEAVNSAESIFAAESGLEHQLSLSYGSEECGTPTEEATFSNGARYEAT